MKRFVLMILALAGLLVSCGGGGGGGGSSSPSFSVSFNRSSLSFDSFEGGLGAPQTIIATGNGDPGGTIYVAVLIEGQGVAPSGITITFTGTQASISVFPRTDLAPGTYTGRLILQACADPQCTRQFAGSPFPVSYTSVIRAGLGVSPSTATLSAAAGTSTSQRISVTPADGASGFNAQVTSGTEWLRIENRNATGFDVVTQPLPGGSYNGSVTITSGTFNRILQVPLTVTPAAGGDRDLTLSESFVTLNVAATASVQRTVTVTPPSWSNQVSAAIAYTAAASGWLSAALGSGNTWALTANAATLNAGTYAARVTFTSAYPSQPRTLDVTLVVGAGLVLPAQQSITVTAETETAQLAGAVPVSVAGGVPFTWTATTSSNWLQLTGASGSSTSPIGWTINPTALSALANFTEHTAQIDVTTSLPNVPGGSVQIVLSRQLPELHQVTPYLLVRGRSERVIVRGRGFDGMLNPAARLSFGAVVPTGVTRINDRQLVVQLPPVAATSLTARATNRLAIDTGTVTLKTVAAAARPYAFYPGAAGSTRSLIHDAERDALFATQSNLGTNSVVRLARSGSAWTSTPIAAADVFDVALTSDGSALLMAMTAGELRWLDPVSGVENAARLTLTDQRLTDDREFFLAQGLSITADGLLWLPADSSPGSPFKTLTTVDLRTRERTLRTADTGSFTLYRGPLFTVPRDGSRMLGRQNSGLSSVDEIYDAIRYDTASGALGRTAKIRSMFDARFSHDGRRAAVNFDRVVDANDDLYGLVRLPAALGSDWQIVSMQINGAGTRVYVLAYPYQSNFGFSSAASGIRPRLYVIDSSAPSASTAGLPILGFAELDDYPSDCTGGSLSCWIGLASTLSADDNTLFFLGGRGLVVMPVPTTLQPVPVAPPAAAVWRR